MAKRVYQNPLCVGSGNHARKTLEMAGQAKACAPPFDAQRATEKGKPPGPGARNPRQVRPWTAMEVARRKLGDTESTRMPPADRQ